MTKPPFPLRHTIPVLVAATCAATTLLSAAAAPAPETMSPFRVEAEFGVDGLRIQNSSAVLNSHLLTQHGVAQFQDITGIAPNLFLSHSDSRGFGDIVSLRGVTNSIFFSSPGVGLYVDDVPGGNVAAYPSSLIDIESVVVRAGPQGTDYGRNAAGGVIDIRTRTPGGSHRGHLQAEYGSENLTAFQGAWDGPLSPQLGYTLALGYSDRDGYIDNTFLRRSVDDRRSLAGRAALFYQPAADLQLRFSVLAEKFDDGGQRLSSLFSANPFTVQSDLNGETQIDRLQLSLQARKKFSWGSLVATTARQEFDLNPSVTDLDLSPLPAAWSRVLQNEETWSQEFRFESLPSTDKSAWRAGLFLAETDTDGDATRQFFVPPAPPFVPPGFIQNERTTFSITQKTVALYGSVDRPLTRDLLLKVGARFEHSDAEIDRAKLARNNFNFPAPQDPRLALASDDQYASGSAGLVYAVNEALSLQARSAISHKPAGYSGFVARAASARFDAEQQWANEVGLTFGPRQGRFGGSLMGFLNRIDDYQFERTVPGSTDFAVVNAPEVTSRGVEAKFMFSPVDKIWWDFSAGWVDTTFERHRDANGADVAGRRVPFVPRHTLRTGVTVELGHGLTANASYAAAGRTYYDERNTSRFSQGAYGIVNAQLRWRIQRVTVAVYGHNLTDKTYYAFINPEIAAGSPAAPRRFGVQLAFDY